VKGRRNVEFEIHRTRSLPSTAKRMRSSRCRNKTYKEGEVIVIRYEGPPKAAPACAKNALDHGGR